MSSLLLSSQHSTPISHGTLYWSCWWKVWACSTVPAVTTQLLFEVCSEVPCWSSPLKVLSDEGCFSALLFDLLLWPSLLLFSPKLFSWLSSRPAFPVRSRSNLICSSACTAGLVTPVAAARVAEAAARLIAWAASLAAVRYNVRWVSWLVLGGSSWWYLFSQ